MELAWLGPGRESGRLGALGDLQEQFPVARGAGFGLILLRGLGHSLKQTPHYINSIYIKLLLSLCVSAGGGGRKESVMRTFVD